MKLPLFNVNGSVGSPSRGPAEFSNGNELLAWMDSLGVARSLVWHIAARDTNPTWGNRELLNEVFASAASKKRLIPALVISPAIIWEQGGIAEIKALMREHRIRALRICPSYLGHTLMQLEPLLRELQEFHPAVFVDCRTLSPFDSIDNLAEAFPEMPVVYTNAAWPQLTTAFDLLARHANLFVDTSWLHICGTLEKIVKEFGAHRAVFGLGYKTGNGASIVDLADAEIDGHAKEGIAFSNLDRLLGLDPEPDHLFCDNTKGALWNQLCDSKPLDIDVIDSHGHLGPIGKWMLEAQQINPQIEDITRRMDRLGINKMIVSGTHALFGDPVFGNRFLEETAGKYPDRFLGYLVFNPHYHREITATLDCHFSREFFVGFKILSNYWQVPITDGRYNTVWDHANRYRLPILIHTWDDPYDFPTMLDPIVKLFPEAIFILGHTGGVDSGQKASLDLAQRYPNVYLEWCGSYQMTLPYEDVIRSIGPGRILFGTDAALHSPAWELGRFLSLELPDKMLVPALGDNMRGILAMRKFHA